MAESVDKERSSRCCISNHSGYQHRVYQVIVNAGVSESRHGHDAFLEGPSIFEAYRRHRLYIRPRCSCYKLLSFLLAYEECLYRNMSNSLFL